MSTSTLKRPVQFSFFQKAAVYFADWAGWLSFVDRRIIENFKTAVSPQKAHHELPLVRELTDEEKAKVQEIDQNRLLKIVKIIVQTKTDQGRASEDSSSVHSKRHLVYVNGNCEHLAGYSTPWWEAMKPHLSPVLVNRLEDHRQEVVWSKIVNDRAVMAAESRAEETRAQQVAAEIKAVLQDRGDRAMLEGLPSADRNAAPQAVSLDSMPRAAFGVPGLDCADDFAKYLTQPPMRRRILDHFLSVVRPKLDEGGHVDLISHSWGTVVAYEGLRELDDSLLEGRVLNFFTVGSPLSIWLVKKMLKESYRDGRKPRHVLKWINLAAQSDAVGGSLVGNPFQVDQDFLNLYPTGCEEHSFLGAKWFSPACTHSSYFHPDNAPVNRDIFARFINSEVGYEQILARDPLKQGNLASYINQGS